MSSSAFDKWWLENYAEVGQATFSAPTDTIKLMLEDAFEAGRKAQAEYDRARYSGFSNE